MFFYFCFLIITALYYGVIRRLQLPEILDYTLGGSFMFAFAVGYALSVHVRCILLLVLPTFFGKSGRSYIGTFALAYLLAGELCFSVFQFSYELLHLDQASI